tara:strand:- start:321 stop:527 length:207 start_codon:yes stop_codon:yes gene_type:complete
MKTIFKSVALIILGTVFCFCLFIIIGLVLNFWNETIMTCSASFVGAIMVGAISFAGIDLLYDDIKRLQ